MKITARIAIMLTIIIFIALCLNILYLCISIFVWGLNIDTEIFHPVVGVLIPIILLINMIVLFHSCYHEENTDFYYGLTRTNKIKVAIYASMGLINPMLLYIHTKSFNTPIMIFGVLRCFPIINIFMYLKLIKRLKQRGYSRNNFFVEYLKGMLILNIIREDKL